MPVMRPALPPHSAECPHARRGGGRQAPGQGRLLRHAVVDTNVFGWPIERLYALVDLRRMEVLRVTDYCVVPIADGNLNYDAAAISRCASRENPRRLRSRSARMCALTATKSPGATGACTRVSTRASARRFRWRAGAMGRCGAPCRTRSTSRVAVPAKRSSYRASSLRAGVSPPVGRTSSPRSQGPSAGRSNLALKF